MISLVLGYLFDLRMSVKCYYVGMTGMYAGFIIATLIRSVHSLLSVYFSIHVTWCFAVC